MECTIVSTVENMVFSDALDLGYFRGMSGKGSHVVEQVV